jgi:hypothetical protein
MISICQGKSHYSLSSLRWNLFYRLLLRAFVPSLVLDHRRLCRRGQTSICRIRPAAGLSRKFEFGIPAGLKQPVWRIRAFETLRADPNQGGTAGAGSRRREFCCVHFRGSYAGMAAVSYAVLPTATWFSSFSRRANCWGSGSRRSRPSRLLPGRNGAQQARARLLLARRSEPLPASTVLLARLRRRTA